MAKLEVHLSIYPIVWTVVLAESGLAGYEVVESVWATEHAARARAHVMSGESGQRWEVARTDVGIGGE